MQNSEKILHFLFTQTEIYGKILTVNNEIGGNSMTVTEKCSRERVFGFLKAENGKMVNGRGEEVLLCGMGVGNWLLPEGYMWRFGGIYERPRRIEQLVRDLCGSAYAEKFWKRFRDEYITESDIRAMAEAGFNSVRLPINWRIVMEDEPGIHWKEDGFALIDRFLGWCEKYSLYVCLDLHGAPGGQTGHNIDDSVDDVPRLFMDTESDSYEKTIELWREFARRYKDRWIVGMFDLLNEPCRTEKPGTPTLPDLREPLKQFYRDCIKAVREIDTKHMFSIESHHWASQASFFTEVFDENMCVHFHRYWCRPDESVLEEFLQVREKLGLPLYLGESGENSQPWFAAMYPLCLQYDIGVNVWPWKKMTTDSSPCSIRRPALWDKVVRYTRQGDRPSYRDAQAAFDEYLGNIAYENCDHVPAVIASITRRPGCVLRAVNRDGGMVREWKDRLGRDTDDFLQAVLTLHADEKAAYTVTGDGVFAFTAQCENGTTLEISVNGETVLRTTAAGEREITVPVSGNDQHTAQITCVRGSLMLETVEWRK